MRWPSLPVIAALLLAACRHRPDPGPSTTPEAPPPTRTCDANAAGHADQFKNTASAQTNLPEACADGVYVRVRGKGTRRLVSGAEGKERGCQQPPEGPTASACPEVFADAFAQAVFDRLVAEKISPIGVGVGACGKAGGPYDETNFSVAISDWAHADAAVAAVDAELLRWGIGHFFGVTVRGIPCATPL